jgi:GNAT superfamily N-acetyltransferase
MPEAIDALTVVDLPADRDAAAARLLANAFLNDPVWRATGPRWSRHRRLVSTLFHLGELKLARREEAYILGALEGETLRGVLVAYRRDRLPPAALSWLSKIMAFSLAGPVAGMRAGRLWSGLTRWHPTESHVYGWLLATSPRDRGTGSQLLAAILSRPEVARSPIYLEATHPDNARLYSRMGWEELGRYRLRTGDAVFPMWRPAFAPLPDVARRSTSVPQ